MLGLWRTWHLKDLTSEGPRWPKCYHGAVVLKTAQIIQRDKGWWTKVVIKGCSQKCDILIQVVLKESSGMKTGISLKSELTFLPERPFLSRHFFPGTWSVCAASAALGHCRLRGPGRQTWRRLLRLLLNVLPPVQGGCIAFFWGSPTQFLPHCRPWLQRKGQLWDDRSKLLKQIQDITETAHLNLKPLPSNIFQLIPKRLAAIVQTTSFNLEVSVYWIWLWRLKTLHGPG